MVKPLNQLVATYAVQAAKFPVGIMTLHITELAVGLAQDTERSTRLPSAKAAITSDQRQGIYSPRHMIRFPRGKADSCLLAKQPPLEKDLGLMHREEGREGHGAPPDKHVYNRHHLHTWKNKVTGPGLWLSPGISTPCKRGDQGQAPEEHSDWSPIKPKASQNVNLTRKKTTKQRFKKEKVKITSCERP